jgi:4-amino-4-deoxy-L-arabinose transferase-like glycosyltransferase
VSIKIELNLAEWIRRIYTFLKCKVDIWHVLLISLVLHFLVIATPPIRLISEDGPVLEGLVFDEAYYVPAAFKTLWLQAANAEHPPLTKIFIALSIAAFGGNGLSEYALSFAVRLPIVIAGVASIYVVYLIAKRYMSERYALLSAVFLSFDIFFFVHGNIAILDMPEILYALIAIYLFLDKKYGWSSFFFGVSFLCLERALFFVFGIFIFALLTVLPKFIKSKQKRLETKFLGKTAAVFIFIFIIVALGGLYLYDIVYKPASGSNVNVVEYVDEKGVPWTTVTETILTGVISNPIQHLMFMWNYYSVLAPTIEPAPQDYRPPWSWTLPIVNVWNPPHYFTLAVSFDGHSVATIDWVSMISYPISYMFWPIFALCIYNLVKKKETAFSLFFISLTSGTYIPWLFFGAFVQRMTFNYYFLVATPFIAMGVPYFWSCMPINRKYKTICVLLHLAVTIIFFAYYFPLKLFPSV